MKLASILLAALVGACVALGVARLLPPAPVPDAAPGRAETAFDRVMRTKTLRCGYVEYQPAVVRDPQTQQLSGFAVDIMKRLGENLGFKIDWVEEVNTATMIEGLRSGRYDMVCTPFWPDGDRAKGADFSIGFYYSGMGAWVRADDHRFDADLVALNDPSMRLSVMDGTTLVEVARQNFPKAQTVTVPQGSPLTDLMLNVKTGKADVVILDNYLARDFEAANPGSIRQAGGGKNVRTYPNAFILGPDERRLKSVIDVAMTELLNSGFVDEAITKFEKYPHTFLRVAPPYIDPVAQQQTPSQTPVAP
jgi:ABC-type amino acid transport substrate-binding protein